MREVLEYFHSFDKVVLFASQRKQVKNIHKNSFSSPAFLLLADNKVLNLTTEIILPKSLNCLHPEKNDRSYLNFRLAHVTIWRAPIGHVTGCEMSRLRPRCCCDHGGLPSEGLLWDRFPKMWNVFHRSYRFLRFCKESERRHQNIPGYKL